MSTDTIIQTNENTKMLKESRYNLFFRASDNTPLMYNTFSEKFAIITSEMELEAIKEILDAPNRDWEDELHKGLKETLIKGKYIINDDIDEFNIIKMKHHFGRYNLKSLSLIICPTNNCNFSCNYCYEKLTPKNMDMEIENKILTFTENNIKSIGLKYLSVIWFGGEPLLNLASLDRLSSKFIEMSDKNNISYNSRIVTNGYLLSKETSMKLKDLRISHFQITIDGDREAHNKRKYLHNGSGTYDKVLSNIESLTDVYEKEQITLRINTDKENRDSILRLLDDLEAKGLKDKLKLNLASVDVIIGKDKYIKNHSMSDDEWNIYLTKMYHILTDRGFTVWLPTFKAKEGASSFCGADYFNEFIIDAYGKLYKCTSSVGNHDEAVGDLNNLENGYLMHLNSRSSCMNYDPFLEEKCKDCKYLPVCNGGCPYKASIIGESYCGSLKQDFQTLYIDRRYDDLRKRIS